MARIQVLELPAIHRGDDMETPFVLVVDQAAPQLPDAQGVVGAYWQRLKVQTGATAVFVTSETLDIV
jgi:hypothetical protein